jgi:hypothetical protein
MRHNKAGSGAIEYRLLMIFHRTRIYAHGVRRSSNRITHALRHGAIRASQPEGAELIQVAATIDRGSDSTDARTP